MISYNDMTFCSAKCLNKGCNRYLTQIHKDRSKSLGLPIAMGDFSSKCNDFRPKVEKGDDR